MKTTKNKNIVILSILTLVVAGTITVAASDMLQGKFGLPRKIDFSKIYLYKNRFVSVVVSPVTSVETSEVTSEVVSEVTSEVVSEVTSTVKTSKVTSKVSSEVTSEVTSKVSSEVTSPITTPVASAVAVSANVTEEAKMKEIKTLTKTILESAAREDYKTNPSKYILTSKQVKQILDLYEKGQSK
jgi:hypothetical protein